LKTEVEILRAELKATALALKSAADFIIQRRGKTSWRMKAVRKALEQPITAELIK
jgi:hypothetical protein